MSKRWTDEEIQILMDNYSNIGSIGVKDLLPHRSIHSIWSCASKIGIEGIAHKINKKYYINECFFKDVNISNSYWAGFVAADGCIKKGKSTLLIQLSKKDLDHLELFKKQLQTNSPIKLCIGGCANTENCRIEIHNEEIVNDLLTNFNITSNKTKTLEPPIHLDLIHSLSYIKGYIDGDGCIYKRDKVLQLSIMSTLEVLEWIKSIFIKFCNVEKNNIYYKQGNYNLVISGKKAITILKLLYHIDSPHMIRKWSKLKDIEDFNIFRLNSLKNGWICGGFVPSSFITDNFEVCYKTHKANSFWDTHYHQRAIEINYLISGKMKIGNQYFDGGDVFIIDKNEISDPVFIQDCCLVVIKTPSVPGDKYIIP